LDQLHSVHGGSLTSIPRLVGWKDGQGDIRRLQMIINHVGARLHWIGGAATTWLRLTSASV
jgi:dihydrodipicolinate synthase/N-acetylneuraminate lyase